MPDSEESSMPTKAELGLNAEVSLKTVTRRSFLGKLAVFGAGALAALANPQALFSSRPEDLLAKKAEAAPLADGAATETLTNQMRREIETRFTVDDIGYRISNVFTLGDDFDYIAYQGLVFQRVRETGEIRPWNTLDVLHDRGYDNFLDDYSKSGVTIPAHIDMDDKSGGNVEVAFNNRIKAFGVNPKVEAFARALRIKAEIGVPTSPTKNYGSYEVTRFQRVAIQEWVDGPQKGLVQRILTGEAFLKTGMVPREAQLPSPDLNFGNFNSQPEQPNKTPETTVNVPPLPSGPLLDEQRIIKLLEFMSWYRKEGIRSTDHNLQLSGKLIDWSVDGNNLVLKIATNKENASEINEITFVPQDQDSIWFILSRPPKPFLHYKSTEIASALKAMDTYFKKGDPIAARRRIGEGLIDLGYKQGIVTWR